MPYVRQQAVKAELDITKPTVETLSKFVELLEAVDRLFVSEADATSNRVRRIGFIKKGEE